MPAAQALERLTASPQLQRKLPPLAVAFNPFFPDAERQQEERQRLRHKLEAGRGRIAAVYLQAGSDAARLEEGLQFLAQLLDELRTAPAAGSTAAQEEQRAQPASRSTKRARQQAPQEAAGSPQPSVAASQSNGPAAAAADPGRPRVYGSLLVPSRKLLALMKFRPWGGVFLRCAVCGLAAPVACAWSSAAAAAGALGPGARWRRAPLCSVRHLPAGVPAPPPPPHNLAARSI